MLALVIAAGCGSPARPLITNHAAPAVVPHGYAALRGPQRCEESCGITESRDVRDAGIQRIGLRNRGLESTLAIETKDGWFFEADVARVPEPTSDPQPRTHAYDLAATRVEDGALVVRLVDAQSVLYPDEGAAVTSTLIWSEQRCVVVDAVVHCSPPKQIASRHCERTEDGPVHKETCTGGPPAT